MAPLVKPASDATLSRLVAIYPCRRKSRSAVSNSASLVSCCRRARLDSGLWVIYRWYYRFLSNVNGEGPQRMVTVPNEGHLDLLLRRPPDFEGYLGAAELEERAEKLAASYPQVVRRREIGRSRQGRPISALGIGSGRCRTLWYAGPHANEPLGGNTVIYL